jgi:hypothetical protein
MLNGDNNWSMQRGPKCLHTADIDLQDRSGQRLIVDVLVESLLVRF